MDRKWLVGLGGAAVLVLILGIVVVFGGGDGGGGPDGAAKSFFAAIPSGGAQAAYDKAAPAFRNSTSPQSWAATVSQYNLTQYASSSWNDAGKGGDVVTLNGVLSLRGGGAQPATLQVVKGAQGWSVYALSLPNGGVNGGASSAQTASDAAGVTSQGGYPAASSPTAPSGATPADQTAETAPPVQSPSAPYAGYGAAPYGQTAANPVSSGQSGGPVVLVPTRVAHDCGPKLLQLPGVQSIDVHCVNGISAIPGTRGRCEAMVNGGQPARVSVMVSSYDPATDDAHLSCRLY